MTTTTTTTAAASYVIRDGRPSDEGFIARGYVGTVRLSVPKNQLLRMPDGAFSAHHYAIARKLLKRCRVRVASHPEDEETLYGFSLVDGVHVHMVYVSKSHWRQGLGTKLLEGLSVRDCIARLWPATMHGTDTAWMRSRLEGLTYLPYWMDSIGETTNG